MTPITFNNLVKDKWELNLDGGYRYLYKNGVYIEPYKEKWILFMGDIAIGSPKNMEDLINFMSALKKVNT